MIAVRIPRPPAAAGDLSLAGALPAPVAETTCKIDPDHAFPSREADPMGGPSAWRGKVCGFEMTVALRSRIEAIAGAAPGEAG